MLTCRGLKSGLSLFRALLGWAGLVLSGSLRCEGSDQPEARVNARQGFYLRRKMSIPSIERHKFEDLPELGRQLI
jgi:hypothetical protein